MQTLFYITGIYDPLYSAVHLMKDLYNYQIVHKHIRTGGYRGRVCITPIEAHSPLLNGPSLKRFPVTSL